MHGHMNIKYGKLNLTNCVGYDKLLFHEPLLGQAVSQWYRILASGKYCQQLKISLTINDCKLLNQNT